MVQCGDELCGAGLCGIAEWDSQSGEWELHLAGTGLQLERVWSLDSAHGFQFAVFYSDDGCQPSREWGSGSTAGAELCRGIQTGNSGELECYAGEPFQQLERGCERDKQYDHGGDEWGQECDGQLLRTSGGEHTEWGTDRVDE